MKKLLLILLALPLLGGCEKEENVQSLDKEKEMIALAEQEINQAMASYQGYDEAELGTLLEGTGAIWTVSASVIYDLDWNDIIWVERYHSWENFPPGVLAEGGRSCYCFKADGGGAYLFAADDFDDFSAYDITWQLDAERRELVITPIGGHPSIPEERFRLAALGPDVLILDRTDGSNYRYLYAPDPDTARAIEELLDETAGSVESLMSQFADFDPEQVPVTLCEHSWKVRDRISYDKDGEIVQIGHKSRLPLNSPILENSSAIYTFHADGSYSFSDGNASDPRDGGVWQYDAQEVLLTLDPLQEERGGESENRILAMGDEVMMWEQVTSTSKIRIILEAR